jgi:hypothetical protein
MQMKLVPKQGAKQKQKMSRRTMIIVAASSSILLLVLALVFIFNIGNIRSTFASAPNPKLDARWTMVSNNGSIVKLRLAVRTNKQNTRLGDANFVFRFDTSSLKFKPINGVNNVNYVWQPGFGPSAGYNSEGTSVTHPASGMISINLNRAGVATLISSSENYTPVIDINFAIVNPTGNFSMNWEMSTSHAPILDDVFSDAYVNFEKGKFEGLISTPQEKNPMADAVYDIKLEAGLNDKLVELKWTTIKETNTANFTIERSSDGTNFSAVLSKPGAGISQDKIDYEAIDENPLEGVSYYRLTQTDLDHKTTVYNTVEITNNIVGEFAINSINPTNFSDYTVLSYKMPATGNATMIITDLSGKVMLEEPVASSKGENTHRIDNATNWKPGMYIVSLQYNGKTISSKVIKS